MNLDSWAYNLHVGGGRFSLICGGQIYATSKKGFQKVLVCHRSGNTVLTGEKRRTSTLKCGCTFRIRIESCVEGWIIAGSHLEHTGHDLVVNHGASLAQASLRFIPKELIELGEKLKHAGFSASKINQALESEAYRRAIPISWKYSSDIYVQRIFA